MENNIKSDATPSESGTDATSSALNQSTNPTTTLASPITKVTCTNVPSNMPPKETQTAVSPTLQDGVDQQPAQGNTQYDAQSGPLEIDTPTSVTSLDGTTVQRLSTQPSGDKSFTDETSLQDSKMPSQNQPHSEEGLPAGDTTSRENAQDSLTTQLIENNAGNDSQMELLAPKSSPDSPSRQNEPTDDSSSNSGVNSNNVIEPTDDIVSNDGLRDPKVTELSDDGVSNIEIKGRKDTEPTDYSLSNGDSTYQEVTQGVKVRTLPTQSSEKNSTSNGQMIKEGDGIKHPEIPLVASDNSLAVETDCESLIDAKTANACPPNESSTGSASQPVLSKESSLANDLRQNTRRLPPIENGLVGSQSTEPKISSLTLRTDTDSDKPSLETSPSTDQSQIKEILEDQQTTQNTKACPSTTSANIQGFDGSEAKDSQGSISSVLSSLDEPDPGQQVRSDKAEKHVGLMNGSCTLDSILPLNKKVVRIFVSSTFSDTKEERNAFMEHVYPKAAQLCREKYGLEFQVVDMRWGVPEQASDNHSTTELCINEIKKCQEVSVGPNFVALLGNKYGYRPIPSSIPVQQFNVFEQLSIEGWETVKDWYCQDENSQPTVYVLQAISSKLTNYNNKDEPELQKKDKEAWVTIEECLTTTLRRCALLASQQGKITDEEKHIYFMSVTESEITRGIFNTESNISDQCITIMRDIRDIKEHINQAKAPKFTDLLGGKIDNDALLHLEELRNKKLPCKVPKTNFIHTSIDWCESGGNISLDALKDMKTVLQAEKVMQKTSGRSLYLIKHREYLESLCQQFLQKLTSLIKKSGSKEQDYKDELKSEVLQHMHIAKHRCEVFEGREEILQQVKAYLNSGATVPLVIYGNSGCGKTSVLSKLFDKMVSWTTGPSGVRKLIVTFIRFLGTTPYTSNIRDLLRSLCQQIAFVYDTQWEEPAKFTDLIKSFHQILNAASKEKPLLLILDSLDQLMPTNDALSLKWLPEKLPPFVKVVLSTIDEGYTLLGTLKNKYGDNKHFKSIEVLPLGEHVGMNIITKWLQKANRCITQDQKKVVQSALASCSLPLYARITFDQIIKWRSFDVIQNGMVETTVKGAIHKLFDQLEKRLGIHLVKHSLSYMTAARHGLSEVEIEHILSLDDDLLNSIYQFWKPPVRRIPPLLWTRVRQEINSYVVERSADGIQVLNWYHRQFIETTRSRYLTDETFVLTIHKNMADFFSGKWGGGLPKPFEYTDAQKLRFGLDDCRSSADRKVPLQPFMLSSSSSGKDHVWYNERKLTELPFHLIKSHQKDVVLENIFFNYEWLFAKLTATSATALVEELELLINMDHQLTSLKQVQLLLATLQLIRPYMNVYPQSLPLELSGRLCHYVGTDSFITSLITQCDKLAPSQCILSPLASCFETADLGLQQNITVRDTAPITKSGVFATSEDFKTIYIADHDTTGKGVLSVWDVECGEQIREHYIAKEVKSDSIDYFLQCSLTSDEQFILLFYRHKYASSVTRAEKYKWEQYSPDGYIDIVDVHSGSVLRTIHEFLHKDDFYNVILYQRTNWIAVRFGWKIPVQQIHGTQLFQSTEPHCLTRDESKLVLVRAKKDVLCKPSAEEEMTNMRSKTVVVRDFKTKEVLADLDRSDGMSGVTLTNDDKRVLCGDFDGRILVYGINRVGVGKRKQKNIIGSMTLPVYEKIHVFEAKRDNWKRLTLHVSPNDQFVMAVYQGREGWEALLWNIDSQKFIGRVTNVMPLSCRYPVFSSDSTCIVVCIKSKVQIYSCLAAKKCAEYDQGQDIRDFKVSKQGNDVAVLRQKDIVFLKAASDEVPYNVKVKRPLSSAAFSCLLDKEELQNQRYVPPLLFNTYSSELVEEENMSSEHPASGAGSERSTIHEWVTPSGETKVRLLLHVQVIDSQDNTIKYTPRSKELLIRSHQLPSGAFSNTQIPMPTSTASAAVDLTRGDRIMAEGNKVKFRVQGVEDGRYKIVIIPSVLKISKLVDKEWKRSQQITVYSENVQALSDRYLATVKKQRGCDFVNIYDLDAGKLLATQSTNEAVSSVEFLESDTKLIIIDKHLVLRIFSGENFMKLDNNLSLMKATLDQPKRTFVVQEVISFSTSPGVLVLRLSEDRNCGTTFYIHVNLHNSFSSPLMPLKYKLDDISQDGRYGVDSQLGYYDLTLGLLSRQLPYHGHHPDMQLQVKLSGDARYIVFVDKRDDTMHVIQREASSFKHIFSCYTHAHNLPGVDGLVLRQYGRIVMLRDARRLGLFVLRDGQESKRTKGKLDYISSFRRARSLLPKQVVP